MTTGHVFIATSLDGFVARKDHRLDWLMKQPTEGVDYGYDSFIAGIDGIVMGRGSYETVRRFGEWPYDKPVRVMSNSLSQSDIPRELEGKVQLTALDPKELMSHLQNEGWARAYIDGGKIVQSFLKEGLIEDLILTVVPILIGQGIGLFGPLPQDIDLELIGTTSFKSGLVQSHYRVQSDEYKFEL